MHGVASPGNSMGLIILGVHRSGTSALAGLAAAHGFFFGDTVPATEDNLLGHWENAKIVDLNEMVLLSNSLRWSWPFFMPESWEERIESNLVEQRDRIIEELCTHSNWAIKDPRLCHLYTWWKRKLNKIPGYGVIFSVRHPFSVAASLQKRNSFSRQHCLMLWAHSIISLLKSLGESFHALVDYDDFIESHGAKFTTALHSVGLQSPQDLSDVDIQRLVPKSLRHHRGHDSVVQNSFEDACVWAWHRLKEIHAIQQPNFCDYKQIIDNLLIEIKNMKYDYFVGVVESVYGEMKSLNSENLQLIQNLTEIHKTRSWRLTKIFRSIFRHRG